ncbi:MAG: NAD(+)/NADH kinase [archaeon]
MKFQKILVVYSERKSDKCLEVIEKVKAILGARKYTLAKSHDLTESLFKEIDLVITIGGDGGFIRAARFLKETPIIGINAEPEYSEGASASLKDDEINFLGEILNGKYNLIKRQRALVKINGTHLKELALNEVFIGTEKQFATARYLIKYRGKEERQKSSGVLVATGSGSNAWFKSAGGKPFPYDERKLAFLVREPYSGKRVFKPQLLSGEMLENESIIFKSDRYSGGIIALDSNTVYNFNKGDIVEISISNQPLNVIDIKK